MPKLTYVGGVSPLDVVLPDRVVTVATGDEFDASADEAARLADHPDFTAPAKSPAKSSPKEEN